MTTARSRLRTLSAWVVSAVLTVSLTAGCSSSPTSGETHSAAAAAHSFLSTYVDPNGRVVRHDQGGDTVSEGQGYALLLCVALGDRALFRTVWRWTAANLQQPSGLFAYHWAGGKVADTTPATDADLQIAWALTLAGTRFHEPALTSAARRVASAIIARELAYDDHGAPVLAAGPWALPSGRPATVEPGYWTPPAEQALATLTGDNRWKNLPDADLAHLQQLTHGGAALPPDWAQLGAGQNPQPIPTPSSGTPPQFGLDAMRALVWESCLPAGRSLVAHYWPMLRSTADAAPLARNLSGAPLSKDTNALSAVAAAAAAADAGQSQAAHDLLVRADKIDSSYPTYYGAAWRALGWVLLTTHRLADC